MTHRLEIPGWRPTLASELKCHPLMAARRKAKDAKVVEQAALLLGIPPVALSLKDRRLRKALGLPASLPGDPTPRRRQVTMAITGRYGSLPDPDAPLKSGLDALVTAGLLVDDSLRWADWARPVFLRGKKGTVIELTDLD